MRAFNALHGGYGENGQIQGALDFYGIRYTGSGVLGSALGLDKFRTKLVWQQTGVPTPPFETVLRGDDPRRARRTSSRNSACRCSEAGERRLERRGAEGEDGRCAAGRARGKPASMTRS